MRLRPILVVPFVLAGVACGKSTPPEQLGPAVDSGVVGADAGQLANDDATTSGDDAAQAGADASEVDSGAVETPDAGEGPRYTWWQDVEPIVRPNCQTCHASPPLFGAPMPLMTWPNTQVTTAMGGKMHELMAFRVGAPQNRMPPPSQPQLTAAQIEIIQAWSAQGAPEGTPPVMDHDAGVMPNPDAGTPAPDAGPSNYNTWTTTITAHGPDPAQPYTLPAGQTNYQCWSVTIPASAPHGSAVRIQNIIDNTQHLHHTLLFKNRNHDSGAGPFDCSGLPLTWDMVSGWAPGRTDVVMPAGVGVSANPGDQFVLQAHYDSVRTSTETDASGVRLVITDEPNLQESGTLWAGFGWLNNINGSNVRLAYTCTVQRAFTMFEIFPHMHQTGTRITLELQRAHTSNWDMVAEVPVWSFHDQPNVRVPMALQQVQPGDKLKTTCWWDTMGRGISWGEASQDEMCFNFINHYPLIPNANLACVGLGN
ncbi:MAG: hypothetical protein U1E65_04455 [Myxococcota bacterium]